MHVDYAIVGGGTAGSVLAARLSESGRSVLLLEAGADHYPHNDSILSGWRPSDTERDRRRVGSRRQSPFSYYVGRMTEKASAVVPRGKVIGGSGTINAQIFLRGLPEDYDAWASVVGPEWSFESLLPFFKRIESDIDYSDSEVHGGSGPAPVRRYLESEWSQLERAFLGACQAVDYPFCEDHNSPGSSGVGPTPLTSVDGKRWSTATGYLDLCRGRPNLVIQDHCRATRLLLSGNRVVGLRAQHGATEATILAHEVVLCAGAIGSPMLLMASGVGDSTTLRGVGIPVRFHLKGVGKNLLDHPSVSLAWRSDQEQDDSVLDVVQIILRCTSSVSNLRNDILIHPWAHDGIVGMNVALEWALSSGSLQLRSAGTKIWPFLDFNFLQHNLDKMRIVENINLCMQLSEQLPYRGLLYERIEPTQDDILSDAALSNWIMEHVRTSHHMAGTCKMGLAGDEDAVVDPFGRVLGIDGLRIVDASIMPGRIRANTNATTILIAERIADFIRHDS